MNFLEFLHIDAQAYTSRCAKSVQKRGYESVGREFESLQTRKNLEEKKAFASLISSQKISAEQIRFIDVIIMYLSANGMIELDRLFYPPFTDVDSQI